MYIIQRYSLKNIVKYVLYKQQYELYLIKASVSDVKY